MKKSNRSAIMKRLSDLAFGKTNDIVKLAFLDPNQGLDQLDALDLTLLSEVKRAANGAVELKLVDRLDAMQLLLQQMEEQKPKAASGEAEQFLQAIQEAANESRASE